MKITFLTIFLLTNLQSAFAAPEDMTITKEFCYDLVTEVTYKGFSPEINRAVYKLAGLNDKAGMTYIEDVRTGLATRMTNICNGKTNISFAEFSGPYLSECSTECKGSYPRGKILGININKLQQEKAEKACWNVCMTNKDKMASIVEGIEIRNTYSGKSPADCSSEIADANKSQEEYEEVMKNNEELLKSLKKFPYKNSK